jgi:hypothetical protein
MSTSSALKAFDDSIGSSVISFSSYNTAPDHPPHHTSSLFAGPSMATGYSLPRSMSFRRFLPGSIDELLRSPFVAISQHVFSFSTTASERASKPIQPTPFLTTVARPITLHDMVNQLHQGPLSVDMPHGHLIKPKEPIPFLPCRVSSLVQADSAVLTLDDMNDETRAVSDESLMNRLSKASEWSTQKVVLTAEAMTI